MQSTNMPNLRDETTKTLHDYFNNNYNKNIIALSLILMFTFAFYLIYLLVDSLIDKDYHQFMSRKAYERYETSKKAKITPTTSITTNTSDLTKSNETAIHKIKFISWSHRNLHISLIHSACCSLWLACIFKDGYNHVFNDLLGFISWDTYLLVGFSSGYFLYDFYDVYANGHLKKEWVICVHHVIVLLTFGYHMTNLINIGYNVMALLMEINSVFLHSRKLLRFYDFNDSSLVVRLNSFLNIASFVMFRFGGLATICWGILNDGPRLTMNYYILLVVSTVLMIVINFILFKRILVKDWLVKSKKTNNLSSAENNFNNYENTSCNQKVENKIEEKQFVHILEDLQLNESNLNNGLMLNLKKFN